MKFSFHSLHRTISPLFKGRQFQENLMTWMGKSDYHTYLQNTYSSIDWNKSVHDGYFTQNQAAATVSSFAATVPSFDLAKADGIEFEMTEKISMGDGSQSNNPWLQELPDPLSRACWDNYIAMSAATARDLGITNWKMLMVPNTDYTDSITTQANLRLNSDSFKTPIWSDLDITYNSRDFAIKHNAKAENEDFQLDLNVHPDTDITNSWKNLEFNI